MPGEASAELAFNPLSPRDLEEPAPTLKALQVMLPVFYYEWLGCWVTTRYDDLGAELDGAVIPPFSPAAIQRRPPPSAFFQKANRAAGVAQPMEEA